MDIEQKLDLIHQIHREQEQNERYLYDNLRQRTYHRGTKENDSFWENYGYDDWKNWREQNVQTSMGNSLRFRLLVSILLFLCFFAMDKKEITYMEVGSNDIVRYISENIEIPKLEDLFVRE